MLNGETKYNREVLIRLIKENKELTKKIEFYQYLISNNKETIIELIRITKLTKIIRKLTKKAR